MGNIADQELLAWTAEVSVQPGNITLWAISNNLPLAGGSDAVAAGEGLARRPSPGLRARLSRRESEILSRTLSLAAFRPLISQPAMIKAINGLTP